MASQIRCILRARLFCCTQDLIITITPTGGQTQTATMDAVGDRRQASTYLGCNNTKLTQVQVAYSCNPMGRPTSERLVLGSERSEAMGPKMRPRWRRIFVVVVVVVHVRFPSYTQFIVCMCCRCCCSRCCCLWPHSDLLVVGPIINEIMPL